MLKSRLYSHISNKLNTEYSQAAMNTADKEFIEQVVRIIEKISVMISLHLTTWRSNSTWDAPASIQE